MKRSILSLIIILSTTGCHQTTFRNPSVPNQCCIPEIEMAPQIPIKNEANVRLGGKVKAYAVNRYIDPSNSRIMHERHVVYRVEEDPTWCLATDEKRQILIGNTLTDGKLNYNPVLMQKELALELRRQRIINEALQTHSEILIDAGSVLSQDHEIMQTRSEQLRRALEEQGNMIEQLKDRLSLM